MFGKAGIMGLIMKFASKLRFPWLFGITASLFVLDLFIPDFIPFADEILLALATLVLGSWRDKRKAPAKQTSLNSGKNN